MRLAPLHGSLFRMGLVRWPLQASSNFLAIGELWSTPTPWESLYAQSFHYLSSRRTLSTSSMLEN